ncbi:hypothetical protein DENSPDRAFT_709730 [Dentipellis sp. KUC8613]|nr:hypothetical protein DENSPDRAFT_709730 [Dentipellis sp. KUC8613]
MADFGERLEWTPKNAERTGAYNVHGSFSARHRTLLYFSCMTMLERGSTIWQLYSMRETCCCCGICWLAEILCLTKYSTSEVLCRPTNSPSC